MLNIQSERALRRRAADRNYHKSLKTSTVNDILNELKREVLMSAVALYDCRHFCPIEIAYSTETAVLRTEVFDDAVYISWYQAPKSLNTPYPESQRFVAESFLYEVQRLEIFRRFEIADHKVTFNGDSTEDDLMMHLQTISQTSVSLNEISALRAEYSDFIKPFENFLSNLQ